MSVSTKVEACREELNAKSRELLLIPIRDLGLEEPHYLSTDQELVLRMYYQGKLVDLCRYYKFSDTVKYKAIWIYKRLFLDKPMIEYDLKHVLIATLFLATKLENHHPEISLFSGIKNITESIVIKYEIELCKVLNFDFNIVSPYLCLYGFSLDVQCLHLSFDYESAKKKLDKILIYDEILHFCASELALAAICSLDRSIVDKYLQCRKETHQITCNMERLEEIMNLNTTYEAEQGKIQEFDRTFLLARKMLKQHGSQTEEFGEPENEDSSLSGGV